MIFIWKIGTFINAVLTLKLGNKTVNTLEHWSCKDLTSDARIAYTHLNLGLDLLNVDAGLYFVRCLGMHNKNDYREENGGLF